MQIVNDPQVKARNMILELWITGRTGNLWLLEYLSVSLRYWCLLSPAPFLGEHNLEVYGEELGLSRDEVEKLQKDGVFNKE